MRHPEFPIVSFLCLPLLLCPLPSHIRACSVSTLALIGWLTVMNIIRGVNTLVWANNASVRLEVWCDITTKITIGFTYAVPAAALCILRHLEHVASTRHVLTTKEDRRRRKWFEAIMCFGVPILFMGLHYIVQGHRFDLVEDLGCAPAQYISAAAVVILWVPPLTISLATMVYAGLALRHFLHLRISFATHLQNSQSSMSPGRYLRLMALAIVVTAWDAGTNIYLLYFNVSLSGLRPYVSWGNVHSNFSRVAVFPLRMFPPWLIKQFILQWWIIPVSCFVFFIFLGFGEEAMSDYRAAFMWLRRTWRQLFTPSKSLALPKYSLPSNHRVDINFLPQYVSEQTPKTWDEDSLKISIPMGLISPKSKSKFLHDVSTPPRAFDPTRRPPPPNGPVPEVDTLRGLSLRNSTSSFFESSSVSHSDSDGRPPTIIVTNPESETSLNPNDGLSAVLTTPSPSQPIIHPSISSRASSYRDSISSDLGITISEAYFPSADTSSRYQEAFLHEPPQVYEHRYGGIQVTVERSVV